jgi:hypothetical protein
MDPATTDDTNKKEVTDNQKDKPRCGHYPLVIKTDTTKPSYISRKTGLGYPD